MYGFHGQEICTDTCGGMPGQHVRNGRRQRRGSSDIENTYLLQDVTVS